MDWFDRLMQDVFLRYVFSALILYVVIFTLWLVLEVTGVT